MEEWTRHGRRIGLTRAIELVRDRSFGPAPSKSIANGKTHESERTPSAEARD